MTLALSKVPDSLLAEGVMSRLMGDFARQLAGPPGMNGEVSATYGEYLESATGELVEFRYADYPLPIGESIMLNHALFTGILHAGATPVTTGQFHSDALEVKLSRVALDPELRSALEDRARLRGARANLLAVEALTRPELSLPVLNPELPIDAVLEHRAANADALGQVRRKLALLSLQITSEPWSRDFIEHVDSEALPAIASELEEVRKARDGWLKGARPRLALDAAGIALGAASAVLAVIVAPLTPIFLATAAIGLAASAALPAARLALDAHEGQHQAETNGLHYLLKV